MEFLQRHITKSESKDQTPNSMGTENGNLLSLFIHNKVATFISLIKN